MFLIQQQQRYFRIIVMYRFCLTIINLSLNLPRSPTSLRFMVRTLLQQPRCIQQMSLNHKKTHLSLNESLVFSIPSFSQQQQQAISVYIVGLTQQMIIHLGMFKVTLSEIIQGQQSEIQKISVIQGCVGQKGEVKYRIQYIKESEAGRNINKIQNIYQSEGYDSDIIDVEAKSSYKSNCDSSLNQSNRNQFNIEESIKVIQELQFDLRKMKVDNAKLSEEKVLIGQQYLKLEKQNKKAMRKIQQLQKLNNKLVQKYQEVVLQNLEFKKQKSRDVTISQAVDLKKQSSNQLIQTDIVQQNRNLISKFHEVEISLQSIQKPERKNNRNIQKCCQTEFLYKQSQPKSQPTNEQSNDKSLMEQQSLFSVIINRQHTHNLQYLSKIQDLQIEELEWELQQTKADLKSSYKVLKKHNIAFHKLSFKQYNAQLDDSKVSRVQSI